MILRQVKAGALGDGHINWLVNYCLDKDMRTGLLLKFIYLIRS